MILEVNHPGFKDKNYIKRRNLIAECSSSYKEGDKLPSVAYIKEEHDLWKDILSRIHLIHKNKACKNYLNASNKISLSKNKIPQLSSVSKIIEKENNFKLYPVYELVSPRRFLNSLSENIMLCTQYIRHHSVPDYTPEPDIIHELIGHAVFFMDRNYCYINNLFGKASLKASEEDIIKLMRLYWYTIEFGLCYEGDQLKVYGAGLLSSIGEMERINTSFVEKMNIEKIINTDFSTTQYQNILFYSDSFDESIREIEKYLFTFIN